MYEQLFYFYFIVSIFYIFTNARVISDIGFDQIFFLISITGCTLISLLFCVV